MEGMGLIEHFCVMYLEIKVILIRICANVAFQLRLSQSKTEKSNTSAKSLLGIANKLIVFISDSQQAFRVCVRLFRFALGQP